MLYVAGNSILNFYVGRAELLQKYIPGADDDECHSDPLGNRDLICALKGFYTKIISYNTWM